jgi:hypothetical protein
MIKFRNESRRTRTWEGMGDENGCFFRGDNPRSDRNFDRGTEYLRVGNCAFNRIALHCP